MTKITIERSLIEQALADLEHISTAAGQVEFIDGTCQKLREALAEPAVETTYISHQATECASCGKHTPLRIDAMGWGYVCLTCIDQRLGSLLGEFGYPDERLVPQAWLWQFSDGDLHEVPFGSIDECEKECAGYEGKAHPLYTSPTPPADVPMIERIPPEKIIDHMRGMDADMLEDLCLFSFSSGVRWAEKQHGIGGEG